MPVARRRFALASIAILSCNFIAINRAAAEGRSCQIVDVDFVPTEKLQIVAWVEDARGNFVDTIYITQLTGTYGIGNRPGIYDLNSGPRFPYGRRENVFPVWAHRHGLEFPLLVFQDGDDRNLSHSGGQSSVEGFFCRPFKPSEVGCDVQTRASTIYTDKGRDSGRKSKYPPREDVSRHAGIDDPIVSTYDTRNPFDAVSRATPPGGAPFQLSWEVPIELPDGDYVIFLEVSEEFDFNATYNATTYPSPANVGYGDHGVPYRGQPSVVYRVPFRLSATTTTALTDAYVGYGDITGADGDLRDPDGTITTDKPGSGASRLLLAMDPSNAMYRVRVESRSEYDGESPAAPSEGEMVDVSSNAATISFVAPGDDGMIGTARRYEIRYRAVTRMTSDNFADGTLIPATVRPNEPGQVQTVDIQGLLPQTTYFVGVLAYDECGNQSPLHVIELTTDRRQTGEVDACFVATAAYGSLLANDVEMLRRFRDRFLRRSVLGELAVEAYYTFGPAAATVIDQSDELRGAARDGLTPIVGWAKTFTGL